jgi:hypothetical protein
MQAAADDILSTQAIWAATCNEYHARHAKESQHALSTLLPEINDLRHGDKSKGGRLNHNVLRGAA